MGRFSVAVIALSFLVFSTDAIVLKVLCEGDEISEWVKCEDNHVLQVEQAKFGRDNKRLCEPTVKDTNSTRICGTKDVYDIISPVCDGKQKCDTFIANTTNLGEVEQCQNVKKYLVMHIECVKIKEPDDDKPIVVEASKEKAKTIVMQDEKARTSFVLFEVQHDSSTSTKPVGLFILLVLGTFCSLYY